jgi:F0F1-type ATP synthase membrane subunit b/b'
MQREKERTLKEIKHEVADLVVASLEKVLDTKIGADKEKELIKKALN